MRLLRPFLCLAVAACASGQQSLGSSRDVSVVGAGALRISRGPGAKVSTVAFPLARVWTALPAVFDSLGIPLTDLDQAKHIVGNSGMKAHKVLGKTPLGQILDCGSTQGFPSADSYDVQFSVLTQLESTAEGATRIGTLVEASARPMAFPGSYARCSSKETLEERIVQMVTARLQR